jgi:flagellar hook-length control protein FliK
MNAAPPVLQLPPSSDAVQSNTPASAAAANPRAGSQDFASALSAAGSKPARKNAANKHQDAAASGSPLPAPGNQPPHAVQPPPPAKSDASSSAGAGGAAVVTGPQPGSSQVPPTRAGAAASATPPDSSAAAPLLAEANLDPAAALAAAGADPTRAAAGAPGVAAAAGAGAPGAATPGIPTSAPTMPHAASIKILATPGTSASPSAPAAPSGNASTDKSGNAAANLAITALNSPAADATLNASGNAPAGAGTDAAAQTAMAAAIAQGASTPNPSSSDDPVVPGSGTAQDGAAAMSNPVAATPAAALVRAAAATAATTAAASAAAASAPAVAQSVSNAAGAGAADKRSRDGNSDSTLAGASNDGSVGAAQLLTSNTSTDNAPAPTFKVAAGVDTGQFGQGVAERVSMMMDGNLNSAKLQVNPPALGPIEVRIALQGGHAQVWLASHSAVTRDALESSSAKLREMLGSQGFSQVSVDISQRSFQERSPPSQAYERAPAISSGAAAVAQVPASPARNANGLLDAYA